MTLFELIDIIFCHFCAILKTGKRKKKTLQNKNEEPNRRREISRNYLQNNEQLHQINKHTMKVQE